MLLRPFIVVGLGCCLWNAPSTLLKLKLWAQGVLYMVFCKDKGYKKPADPAQFAEAFKKKR